MSARPDWSDVAERGRLDHEDAAEVFEARCAAARDDVLHLREQTIARQVCGPTSDVWTPLQDLHLSEQADAKLKECVRLASTTFPSVARVGAAFQAYVDWMTKQAATVGLDAAVAAYVRANRDLEAAA